MNFNIGSVWRLLKPTTGPMSKALGITLYTPEFNVAGMLYWNDIFLVLRVATEGKLITILTKDKEGYLILSDERKEEFEKIYEHTN